MDLKQGLNWGYRAQNGVINWVVIPSSLNQGQIWVMGPKTGSEFRNGLFTLKLDLWTAFGYTGFSVYGLFGRGAFGYTGFWVYGLFGTQAEKSSFWKIII
jgi:hypothetical protein